MPVSTIVFSAYSTVEVQTENPSDFPVLLDILTCRVKRSPVQESKSQVVR